MIKSKKIIIGIVILLMIVGIILYLILSNRKDDNVSNNIISKLQSENKKPVFDFDKKNGYVKLWL